MESEVLKVGVETLYRIVYHEDFAKDLNKFCASNIDVSHMANSSVRAMFRESDIDKFIKTMSDERIQDKGVLEYFSAMSETDRRDLFSASVKKYYILSVQDDLDLDLIYRFAKLASVGVINELRKYVVFDDNLFYVDSQLEIDDVTTSEICDYFGADAIILFRRTLSKRLENNEVMKRHFRVHNEVDYHFAEGVKQFCLDCKNGVFSNEDVDALLKAGRLAVEELRQLPEFATAMDRVNQKFLNSDDLAFSEVHEYFTESDLKDFKRLVSRKYLNRKREQYVIKENEQFALDLFGGCVFNALFDAERVKAEENLKKALKNVPEDKGVYNMNIFSANIDKINSESKRVEELLNRCEELVQKGKSNWTEEELDEYRHNMKVASDFARK